MHHIIAANRHLPFRGGKQGAYDTHKGAFTGSIRAKQPEKPCPYVKVNAVKCDSIIFIDMPDSFNGDAHPIFSLFHITSCTQVQYVTYRPFVSKRLELALARTVIKERSF
jgi:hypothetical protein